MGGLGPGIGGLELLVIGLLALIVVGPKDLPVLFRKVGQAVGKARALANEFRASFDEMARQSELDELRKEVEALRRGQGLVPLGAEAEATFRDISDDLNRPLETAPSSPALAPPTPDEWPDSPPVMAPLEPAAETAEPTARKTTRTASAPKPTTKTGKGAAKTGARKTTKPRKTIADDGTDAAAAVAPKPRRAQGKTGA